MLLAVQQAACGAFADETASRIPLALCIVQGVMISPAQNLQVIYLVVGLIAVFMMHDPITRILRQKPCAGSVRCQYDQDMLIGVAVRIGQWMTCTHPHLDIPVTTNDSPFVPLRMRRTTRVVFVLTALIRGIWAIFFGSLSLTIHLSSLFCHKRGFYRVFIRHKLEAP